MKTNNINNTHRILRKTNMPLNKLNKFYNSSYS